MAVHRETLNMKSKQIKYKIKTEKYSNLQVPEKRIALHEIETEPFITYK